MELAIPFNRPYMTGRELWYIAQAHQKRHLSGDGAFTKMCQLWLEQRIGCKRALLTHSCTGALEMAAILADLQAGDEVILPSFTHSSTANAFALRGGRLVFVDIRPDTLNLDEKLIEAAITPKTRAIVPVHYAGVACEMDAIMAIAARHKLTVIEDAAQGISSTYRGRPLGGIGHFGALSFHETKNVMAGEGGALLINDARFIERAEIIREKGTNRTQFFRGEIDKYTWVDIGSSFLPSELTGAFLSAQFEEADSITAQRLEIWHRYHKALAPLEAAGALRRPIVPADCEVNAHMYYILLNDLEQRQKLIAWLRERGIGAVFHYVPLHSSPAGKRFGRAAGEMRVTNRTSDTLLRLPLWVGLNEVEKIVSAIAEFLAPVPAK
jgi:dTDP-4-amino-4,6-dideoxygalactose transaminase